MQFVRTYLDIVTLRYGPQLITEVPPPVSVESARVGSRIGAPDG
jgi:hypothetical protein